MNQGKTIDNEFKRQRCQPSSIRLLDNDQFKFGHALRSEPTYFESVMGAIKSTYLTKWKGFDLNQICVATLLFEGKSYEENRVYFGVLKFTENICRGGRGNQTTRGKNLCDRCKIRGNTWRSG